MYLNFDEEASARNLYRGLCRIRSNRRKINQKTIDHYYNFADWLMDKNERSQFPLRFIYSDGDRLIPGDQLRKIFAGMADAGIRDFSSVNFETPNHVANFREKPDLYTKELHKFYESALEKIENTPKSKL